MDEVVQDSEDVARILNRGWFMDDELMHIAFALRYNETYISVNRTESETFATDVRDFVETHDEYLFGEDANILRYARLNVGEIRRLKVSLRGIEVSVNVEIEPRDARIKSHAGIFTRQDGKNIKPQTDIFVPEFQENVSADDILLKVRYQLLALSDIKQELR